MGCLSINVILQVFHQYQIDFTKSRWHCLNGIRDSLILCLLSIAMVKRNLCSKLTIPSQLELFFLVEILVVFYVSELSAGTPISRKCACI